MSFSSLPTELVRQIIESSVPSTFHSTTYRERQVTLRSLCLVSRQFFQIAQTLLFEIVWIRPNTKLDTLLKTLEPKGWKEGVLQAIIEDKYDWRFKDGRLGELVRSSRDLRSLTLSLEHGETLDLCELQALPCKHNSTLLRDRGPITYAACSVSGLANLCLLGPGYRIPSTYTLPALTSLSFDYMAIELAPTLLNPRVLPSLRSLTMFAVYGEDEISKLQRSRLAALVPQLEVLCLHSRIIIDRLHCLVPAYSRALFDYVPLDPGDRATLLQTAVHLRVCDNTEIDQLDLAEVIPELVKELETRNPIALRSIYLNSTFQDLSTLSQDMVKIMEKLLEVCEEKGTEVIYEDQKATHGLDLSASVNSAGGTGSSKKLE